MKLFRRDCCWFINYNGEDWICGTLTVAIITIEYIKNNLKSIDKIQKIM